MTEHYKTFQELQKIITDPNATVHLSEKQVVDLLKVLAEGVNSSDRSTRVNTDLAVNEIFQKAANISNHRGALDHAMDDFVDVAKQAGAAALPTPQQVQRFKKLML